MNPLREQFNNKKFMAENFRADMTFQDFTKAVNARSEMIGNLAFGKKNAHVGKSKPSRAEVRARRGNKKAA